MLATFIVDWNFGKMIIWRNQFLFLGGWEIFRYKVIDWKIEVPLIIRVSYLEFMRNVAREREVGVI